MAQLSQIQASRLIDLLRAATAREDQPVWIQAPDRLGLGSDRQKPHSVIDLASEEVRFGIAATPDTGSLAPPAAAPLPPLPKASRQTGKYVVDIRGQQIVCTSLKHLLGTGLLALEKARPGTLDKLSRIKPRTKRIVARNAGELFDQAELSVKYAERLSDSWWFGTNNSAAETNTWLARGCEIAGLEWGKDFTTILQSGIQAVGFGGQDAG